MDAVISALEHTLSQTREPELRQQLTDTIERLRKSELPDEKRAQRSLQSAPAQKTKAPRGKAGL